MTQIIIRHSSVIQIAVNSFLFMMSRLSSIVCLEYGRKEENVLFNDALDTLYLRLYGIRHMVKNHSAREEGRKKEGNVLFNDALNTFYLRLYDIRHMVKNRSAREESRCCHMGYSFRLTARSFICIIPQTGQHIPRPLLQQSWSTGWNEK